MKYKKSLMVGLLVLMFTFFVFAINLDDIVATNPAAGQNVSGTLSNLSAQLANHNWTHNTNVTNISFMWQLTSNHTALGGAANHSFMLNTTVNNFTCGLANCANISYFNASVDTTVLPDGVYNITLMMVDVEGAGGRAAPRLNFTAFRNITVDNTNPTVTMITSTVVATPTHQVFNASINDATAGIPADVGSGVVFQFNNGTGVSFNRTGGNGSGSWNTSVNVSAFCGASCGSQTLTIFANDSSGNLNKTTTFTFTPNVPSNVTLGADMGVDHNLSEGQILNINITVQNSTSNTNHMPIHNVIFMFENNTGKSFNVTASQFNGTDHSNIIWNYTLNASSLVEGHQNVTMFVNDSRGHLNKTTVFNFTVDKSGPSVSVTCTANPVVGDRVDCSCSATDAITGISGAVAFTGGSNSESTTAVSAGTFTSSICSAQDYLGNTASATGSYTVTEGESSGSGSSGSGGGVSVGKQGVSKKKTWTSINAGETAVVEVDNGKIGVTEVSFKTDKTIYGAWLNVEKVEGLPSATAAAYKGDANKIYRRIKISKGIAVKDELVKNAEIDFKVENSWLTQKGLDKSAVAMFRFVDDAWVQLPTAMGTDDGTYVHYTATSPGFSYFVIGEKQEDVAAPATTRGDEGPGGEPAKPAEKGAAAADEKEEAMEQTDGGNALPIVAIVVILAIILGVVYFMTKKK